jgi:hypothetical protein
VLGRVGAAVGCRSAGDEWWELYATDPDRSPNTLAIPESQLRLHVRPGSATAERQTAPSADNRAMVARMRETSASDRVFHRVAEG